MSNPRVRKQSVRLAVANTFEALEGRRMLNAAYFPLASGPLTQDWENAALITTNNDWSGVPSIEGFAIRRGTSTTGTLDINTNPQTRLDEPTLNSGNTGTNYPFQYLNVTANSTLTATNGGLSETTAPSVTDRSVIGTSTMAFFPGDTTANNVALKLYVDNSGQTQPVRIKYNLVDVGTGTSVAVQQFALMYRIGNSGNYTNVPAGYVANAGSTVANESGKTTTVDVVLPADTIGASQIQIRILETNGSATDQAIAVDNILVQNAGPGSFGFDQTAVNINEAAGTLNLTVSRPVGSAGVSSVDYSVTNINASSSDYTLASGTLTFGADELSKLVAIPIVNDGTSEGPERFTLTLSNPTNGAVVAANATTATVTLIDDDSTAPATSLLLNEILINPADNDEPGEYIEIRGTPGQTLNNVQVVTFEGDRTNAASTTAGAVDQVFDLSGFTIGSNGLLILKSPLTTFPIPAGTTVVTSTRFSAVGGIIENASATYGILYDTTPYVVGTDYFADATASDPNALLLPGTTQIFDLVGVIDTPVGSGTNDRAWGAIVYSFGTTGTPDAVDAITRFPTDNTAYTSVAAVASDTSWYGGNITDPDPVDAGVTDPNGIAYSNLNFTANKPAGAAITPGDVNFPGVANPGQIGLGPTRYTAEENLTFVSITVYRAGGTSGSVSVNYATLLTGTATPGSDFIGVSGTITFADGETVKTFDIPIIDDAETEAGETIEIALSAPTGGATLIGPATARVTIGKSDSAPPPLLLLNEVLTNPITGTETPAEYTELRGTPNAQLVDVYLIVVEGDGTEAGRVDFRIDLTGARIGSNGLLLIRSNVAGQGFVPEDSATGVFGIANYAATGDGFESGSMTLMLVYAGPGSVLPVVSTSTNVTDYDNNGAGGNNAVGRSTLTFDTALNILDSFAYNDGGAADAWYSDAVLNPPTGSSTFGFGAVSRFDGDDRVNTADAFFYGVIATDPNLPAGTPANLSKLYSSATGARSDNFPANISRITPGAANVVVADTTAPTVVSAVFNPAVGQKVVVTFSEDVRNVANGLTASDFSLTSGATTVALSVSSVSADGKTVTLVFGSTGGLAGGTVLLDGTYAFTVRGGQVADLAGNALAADAASTFKFRNADFNNDDVVGFDDLLALAQSYDPAVSGRTYAQGDANYDGKVDFDDLLALAQRYGNGAPLPALAAQLAPAPAPAKAKAPAAKRAVLGTDKAIV